MNGCSANSSDSAGSSSSPAASGPPDGMPSGGPGGGGGMGPGASEVRYADFTGVTTDGKIVEDLYSVHSTDVSTDATVKAAQAFLDGPRAPTSSRSWAPPRRRSPGDSSTRATTWPSTTSSSATRSS
ncbi:hypothetical protein ACIP79_06060 [Streptomyces sp. NPDC088747]|uniref:hypothetical protein n=1 Tax=Streptomyces sp. NPDC088747 TaxID=3365886 RepID=UPI00380F95AB